MGYGCFHEVKIEGNKDFPKFAKVFVDGNSILCRGYVIRQSVDEIPTVELEILGIGETEHIAKVEISDMENIAKAMDKEEFEKFCAIWNELHGIDLEDDCK